MIVLYSKKWYYLNWGEQLFVFVSAVYLINIFIDIFWQNYPVGMGNPIDLMGFTLSILIALAFRYDKAFVSNHSFFFFLISLAIGLVIAFFLAKESPFPLVGRYDANSTVNTINYGQMGCALSLVSVYGLLNRPFKYSKLIYPLLFLLGIISIMKAGSRSPVVVLLAVSVFYFFAKAGFMKGIILVSCTALIFYFSIGILIELSEAVGSSIVTRLLSAIETGETSGRDNIYENAIGQFLDSPFFGNYYLIPSGIAKGYYPHNFFIEAFMTVGIFGGIPYVVMVAVTMVKSYKVLKNRHPSGWIILLFLQILIFGMFSSSLYSSQDFWALSFFILSLKEESLVSVS
ncbi:O-antigen ligase family protein [Zobellia alginiliquefaciens]|uniref:O-antigen ligase family protein n=1 Tax=Zobellia alginiliquefaciens TaxID=3032586 RepID=UPI0023E23BEC|nr:O-antigen ligase family protein [Zobellia alginiliquefaciens]